MNVRRFTEPATDSLAFRRTADPGQSGRSQNFFEPLLAYCANVVLARSPYTNRRRRVSSQTLASEWEEGCRTPPAPRSQVNRRDFLRAATAAAVAPMIVPRHVIAGSQATPPSDRITIGHIGVGRMGGGHVRGFLKMPDVRILGHLRYPRGNPRDVSRPRSISSMAIRNAVRFTDFRELLARPDIDAVVIAPGERWHPLIGIEAARRGKHIYCEKPLSVTLAEGLALREAVKKYGVVFQWGTQQRSSATTGTPRSWCGTATSATSATS